MRYARLLLIPAIIISFSVSAQTTPAVHKPAAKTPAASAATVNGKKLYVKYCLSCHQADGGGVMNMNPPLTHTSYVLGDKSSLIRIVLNGFNQGVEISGNTYTNAMPSFSYLKDKDIADVLTYIRSHFTNRASAVKMSDVAQCRGDVKK